MNVKSAFHFWHEIRLVGRKSQFPKSHRLPGILWEMPMRECC
jgi:hypothetical protein